MRGLTSLDVSCEWASALQGGRGYGGEGIEGVHQGQECILHRPRDLLLVIFVRYHAEHAFVRELALPQAVPTLRGRVGAGGRAEKKVDRLPVPTRAEQGREFERGQIEKVGLLNSTGKVFR